jgi:CheY-like chemotaxis protein
VNIKIERRIIENVGCVVESVTDGEKGVEAFRASPEGSIDLILMDIRMPVMDGIEAARAIRSLKRSDAGTVPIIAMSANAFTEDVEKSKRAGMNEHLSKPVNKDELYKVMSKYI